MSTYHLPCSFGPAGGSTARIVPCRSVWQAHSVWGCRERRPRSYDGSREALQVQSQGGCFSRAVSVRRMHDLLAIESVAKSLTHYLSCATHTTYAHTNVQGSAAYVGRDNAVFDVPQLGPLLGTGAGVLWKGFETYSQFSLRNQILVASDWVRTKLFGRDISRV